MAESETPAQDVSGDAAHTEENPWYFPSTKKSAKTKKDGTPRKPRRGWGPYRSVPNERAVAFNLQLDVQNLQQEVQNLTALRDILRARVLQQRHSPDGSLVRLVKEYFQVFRRGSVMHNPTDVNLAHARYQDQRSFMFSVVDADVDVGNGVRGPTYMMYQMDMYSTLIRWLCITMHSFDIVTADNSVVITTNSTLRFRVVRATIEKIFPHILGDEWLVAQLLGQEAEPNIRMTFYFNSEDRICKMDKDMDFLGAFTDMLKDPAIVEMLFRRALIADNSQLGMIKELPELEEEEKVINLQAPSSVARQSTNAPMLQDVQTSSLQTVEEYFATFSNGYQAQESQHRFLLNRFISTTAQSRCSCRHECIPRENSTSAEYVAGRWRSLSECFSVVGFHQRALGSVEYHQRLGTCAMSLSAKYTLRITAPTLQTVFPHVSIRSPLYDELLGKTLVVPSQMHFSCEVTSGCICRLEERMDFMAAMAKLVANEQELQFVLAQAKLVVDGVSYRSEDATPNLSDNEAGTARTMDISGILC